METSVYEKILTIDVLFKETFVQFTKNYRQIAVITLLFYLPAYLLSAFSPLISNTFLILTFVVLTPIINFCLRIFGSLSIMTLIKSSVNNTTEIDDGAILQAKKLW